jgi:hypothetical protein
MVTKKKTPAPSKEDISESAKAHDAAANEATKAAEEQAKAEQQQTDGRAPGDDGEERPGVDTAVEGATTNSSVDESVPLNRQEGAPVTTEPDDENDFAGTLQSEDEIFEETDDDAVGVEAFVFNLLEKVGANYGVSPKSTDAHIYNELNIPLSKVGEIYYALQNDLTDAPIDFTLSEVENFQRVRDIINDIKRKLDGVGVAYKP